MTFSAVGVSDQIAVITQAGAEPPVLTIIPDNQNVTYEAGTTTFTITSNVIWTAQSDQDWCTINNTSGTGDATLTVDIEANTDNSQRIATLSVTGLGLSAQNATVTQQSVIPTEIVWELTSFPADLYGRWYSDYDGSYQWNISGSTTIRTFNLVFIVHSTYGFAGAEYEYKVITTEGGRWHTFFFKNVTSSNMHATFTNCPSSPIGFDTENEALEVSSGYNQYCNGNHK